MTPDPSSTDHHDGRLRTEGGCRTGRKPATHGLRAAHPSPGTPPRRATQVVLHRPGCRPGGCAGLCTDEALAVIYRAYRGPLLRRSRTLLGDSGLAEEVVQETFVRAWRACPSFDPQGSPMLVWLSVILRNLAIDRMRSRGRRPSLAHSLPDEGSTAATLLDTADLMLLRVALRDALARLPDDHRTAVVETVLLDRPCEEVAAQLGVPVGTVKSRAHYALRRLRRILEAQSAAERDLPGHGLHGSAAASRVQTRPRQVIAHGPRSWSSVNPAAYLAAPEDAEIRKQQINYKNTRLTGPGPTG